MKTKESDERKYSAECGRLVRKCNCVTGDYCDYTIVGDKDPYLKEHEQYTDEMGYIRNR